MISVYKLSHCTIVIEYLATSNAVLRTSTLKEQTLYLEDDIDAKHATLTLPFKPTDIELKLAHAPRGTTSPAALAAFAGAHSTPYQLFSSFATTQGKFTISLQKPQRINYLVQCPFEAHQAKVLDIFISSLRQKLFVEHNPQSRPVLRDLTNLSPPSKTQARKNELSKRPVTSSPQRHPFASPSAKRAVSSPLVQECLARATGKQKEALQLAFAGHSLFFTGGAGVGKSYVLQELIRCLNPATTAATSTTGITSAALKGTTVYHWCGISSAATSLQFSHVLSKVIRNPDALQRWKATKTLIIDEVSMLDCNFFTLLEAVARAVRKSLTPFGGIQLILCGDCLQLPPVSKPGEPAKGFIFESLVFRNAVPNLIELDCVYRQNNDLFIRVLNNIRQGLCTDKDEAVLKARINAPLDAGDGILPTMLMCRKSNVDEMNMQQLSRLSGDMFTFTATDSGNLQLLESTCPAKRTLNLKIGAQVILCHNVDISKGLANGAKGVVVRFNNNKLPVVRFTNDLTITVTPEEFAVSSGSRVVASRKQVPLQLAWSISIHKSQGMTLDKVIVDLQGVFENAMVYVALSRVRDLSGLQLRNFDKSLVRAHPKAVAYYNQLHEHDGNNVPNLVSATTTPAKSHPTRQLLHSPPMHSPETQAKQVKKKQQIR